MPDTDAVRAHYDSFPYPTIRNLVIPQPVDHRRHRLSYLLNRRPNSALRADARIWVAGCGTQQGALWGAMFPKAKILATDLSPEVLAQAQPLAQQLGLRNVRFEKHDLMTPGARERFDLVVSTGVIHHLPEPAVGLKHLRDSLRPGGAIQLMVYSTMHRGPVRAVREATSLLTGADEPDDERYRFAGDLVKQVLASDRCAPQGAEALKLLNEQADEDRSFVADAVLHPLETTYDIDGLLALLDEAGLEHRSWLQPELWELDSYLDEPDLTKRFEALPPRDRWHVVYCLAGYAHPMLELLAEPKGTEPRPYALDELMGFPLQRCTGARAIVTREGKPIGETTISAYEQEGTELVGRPSAGYGSPRKWRCPADAEPILLACDGQTDTSAVLAAHRDQFGEQPMLELLGSFLPDCLGLITPLIGP